MPRKVPFQKKMEWLSAFEKGETVAHLANYHKKDPRTVQRGIEEARHKQLATEVRSQLLKEGLKQHLDELLALLDGVVQVLQPPPTYVELRDFGVQHPSPLLLPGLEVRFSGGSYTEVRLQVEGEFGWRLLREHLGNDKAYLLLSRWKAALLSELNARLALRTQIEQQVAALGLTRVDEASRDKDGILAQGLHELERAVTSLALGESPPYGFEVTLGNEGVFFINKLTAGTLVAGSQELLAHLGMLAQLVASGASALRLRDAHLAADDAARRAREAFQEVLASHYLPGVCRSCSRFGQ